MKINPHFKVIIAAAIFGSSGAFVKYLGLPITSITFLRLAVPTLLMGYYFLLTRHRLTTQNIRLMLLASLLNAVRLFLYFTGYTYASIGNAVILLYTWPIFAAIFSVIFLKEKFRIYKFLLIFTAFAGIILIYSNKVLSFKDREFIGMAAIMLSAIIYSLTVIIFKKESLNFSRGETIFYQNLVGALLYFPFFFMNPFPELSRLAIGSTYAFLIGIAGFSLFFSALRKIKASTASLLTYFEVISALFFAVLFFDETITWNMLAGGSLIIIAAIS
ncbi:MAG: DMT family transporter, partial [bacterium]|nr:DMT family transporter [bacterium]